MPYARLGEANPQMSEMMTGYVLGAVYDKASEERRKLLYKLGLAGTVLFVIVRLINAYGDPVPWRYLETPVATVLSFLTRPNIHRRFYFY